jgi:hypothetical protein
MCKSFSSCVTVVIALLAASCTPCLAQGFYVSEFAQITVGLQPFTLNGVTIDPSCNINSPGANQLAEISYTLFPFACGGTYEAADPQSGALYTETGVASINRDFVDEGSSAVSISISGGTADPNVSVGSTAFGTTIWVDTLTVTGPPQGNVVMLRLTDFIYDGNLVLSGIGPADNPQLNQQVYLLYTTTGGSPACGTAPQSAQFSNIFTTNTPSISSRQHLDLCTTSGSTLVLTKTIEAGLAGEGGSWSGQANLNDTAYVDSLTPGVTLIWASKADYSTPGATVPPSSSSCDGTYSGTFNGNLNISSGQTCIFTGGGITGHVTQTGGELLLTNATIGGNVHVEGDSTFSIGPLTTIGGNLQIKNIPESTTTNAVCNTNVKGNVELDDVGSGVEIGSAIPTTCGSNSVGGNLHAQSDTGATEIYGNSISGNLHVNNDSAETQVYNNSVGNNLVLEGNGGSTQVFNNMVLNDLQCNTNSTITGGGNTAKKKSGQCKSF